MSVTFLSMKLPEQSLASAPIAYRRVVTRQRAWDSDEFLVNVHAGWDLLCCQCEAVVGRLWMPFSGGYHIAGSSSQLDPRLVERDGPEQYTGRNMRRYGPPTRVFAKGKGQRSPSEARPGIGIHGEFWVYCYACNTGQAVEPTLVLKPATT
jgi:hypothetical protein